ncbi:MAG: hypothetical protein HY537_07880 [Deltaproteobacteria bacterium]|nr:hypothetical protein [Deltaproteobacteria bacterium]
MKPWQMLLLRLYLVMVGRLTIAVSFLRHVLEWLLIRKGDKYVASNDFFIAKQIGPARPIHRSMKT